MKKINFFACLLVLQFSVSSLTFAQESKSFLVRPWAVGQSTTYQIQNFQNGQLVSSETDIYSIVGLEVIDGKNYLWLEIERDEQGGVTSIHKLEVRQPSGIDFENVLAMNLDNPMVINSFLIPRRRIEQITLPGSIKRSSANEFETTAEAVSQVDNGPEPSASQNLDSSFSTTTDQTAQVQSGNFKAAEFQRIKNKTIKASAGSSLDAFGSPEVPIWGLVQKTIRSNGGKERWLQKTELVSFSDTGAISKIKGMPRVVSLKEQSDMKRITVPKSLGPGREPQ